MNVLDATFLIDYLDGVEATRQFYEDNGGDQIRWIVPMPALAEVLVGEGNLPSFDPAHLDPPTGPDSPELTVEWYRQDVLRGGDGARIVDREGSTRLLSGDVLRMRR